MQTRVNKELTDLTNNPPENCSVGLVGDDMSNWRIIIPGPQDTPYAGGNFELAMEIPANYPFRPPQPRFVTRIYHPNVKSDDGSICADVFANNWAPTLNIRYVIDTILSMMNNPMPEHAVEPEIATQMQQSPEAFEATAREWTTQYAQ